MKKLKRKFFRIKNIFDNKFWDKKLILILLYDTN